MHNRQNDIHLDREFRWCQHSSSEASAANSEILSSSFWEMALRDAKRHCVFAEKYRPPPARQHRKEAARLRHLPICWIVIVHPSSSHTLHPNRKETCYFFGGFALLICVRHHFRFHRHDPYVKSNALRG